MKKDAIADSEANGHKLKAADKKAEKALEKGAEKAKKQKHKKHKAEHSQAHSQAKEAAPIAEAPPPVAASEAGERSEKS